MHRVSFLNRNSSGNGAQRESEAHPACGSREREGFRGVGSELSERAREWERGKIAFSADSTSCIMRSKQQRRERGWKEGRDGIWDGDPSAGLDSSLARPLWPETSLCY